MSVLLHTTMQSGMMDSQIQGVEAEEVAVQAQLMESLTTTEVRGALAL